MRNVPVDNMRNAMQSLDVADIDQAFRLRQTQLHQRDQAMTAGQEFGVLAMLFKVHQRFFHAHCGDVFKFGWDHWAFLNSLQTFSGFTGMSMCRTPNGASASTTAFTSAGAEPIVPPSPTPFTPIEFTDDAVRV